MAKVVITDVFGLKELQEQLLEIGKGANKVVTPAAKAAANIALASARANAPKGETGELAKGIIITGEKKKGAKKVYQVGMDPAKNDIFIRMVNGKRYYYPASIEYGFIVHSAKGDYKTEGVHFLRDALTSNVFKIEKAMLDKLEKIIDKELKKQGKR